MGQQQGTHIANTTDETLEIVLTSKDSKNISIRIPSHEARCTPHMEGAAIVSVFPPDPKADALVQKPIAEYEKDLERGFIIKHDGKTANVIRAKLGTIWQEDEEEKK